MSRTTKVITGTMTGWVQFFLNFCLQVAVVPVLLKVAGQETLGAYAILIQILGYLALVDLGLSATTMRFLSQAYGYSDNGKRFRDVLSIARTCLLTTNIAFAILAVLFSVWLKDFVNLSDALISDSRISIYMIAFWALIRSPWVIYAGGLMAIQKMASANMTYMVGNIVRLLFSIGLVLAGMGLVGLILANILAEVVSTILFTLLFRKHYGKLKLGWKLPDQKLFKEILGFGFHILVINISSLLIFSTDNMVVGFLYGAVATSIYYSTQIPAMSGYTLILMLSRNASPAINELYGRNDINSLQNVFIRLHRYTLLLAIPFAIGLLLLNKTFIGLWVGPQQYAGHLMTLGLAGLILTMCISCVSNIFVQAKGNIRFLSILTFFEGVLNLLLSLWLGKKIGIPGVILATFFTHIPTTMYLQWRAHHDLKITLLSFCMKSLLPAASLSAIAAILLLALTTIIHPTNWIGLIATALSFLFAYSLLCYWFALEKSDKTKLAYYLQRIVTVIQNSHILSEKQ